MTPRKASLRVAHQGSCPNANATALDSLKGCKCSPSFYTFHRGRDGRAIKSARIKDRDTAQKAVNNLQVEIDEGRVGQSRPKQLTFSDWADQFDKITESRVRARDLKGRTLDSYRETLELGRTAIGDVPLREIGPAELRRFDGLSEDTASATRLRQLRQLGVCLSAAVDEGHLEVNPVSAFKKKLRLRAPRRGKAPFDDVELERMWTAYQSYEPVYGFVSRFSTETGARLNEIVALDWRNVDLTNGRVLIEHTWDAEAGLVPPKDREPRTVHLTPQARAVVEQWVALVGAQTDGPVFSDPVGGGRLKPQMVQRRLALAMRHAAVPKIHPELRLPRSFHSLRYTTSVLMQRRGVHPRLIEQTLGHSSLELSLVVYGGWTPSQLDAEATRES